jgi:hypothetical protein
MCTAPIQSTFNVLFMVMTFNAPFLSMMYVKLAAIKTYQHTNHHLLSVNSPSTDTDNGCKRKHF